MVVKQVYELVNSVVAQAMGTNELQATDTTSLVAMGQRVLNDNNLLDNFINTLVDRIGKTIVSYRKYTNKMADMVLDDFEFGAIVQKIKVQMPNVEEDETLLPEDGGSVDHYKVARAKATQTFFANEAPYQVKITIQKKWLKTAFLSPQAMGGFISAVFGEVRNKLDLTLEVLGRTCLNNFIANTIANRSNKVINLVSDYNSESGKSLSSDEAYFDDKFLRYAVSRIKEISSLLTDMSREFNDGTEDRHTPFDMQKLKVLSKFQKRLETVVQYAAFNDKYVKLNGFQEMNFWQSIKKEDRAKISVNGVTVDNVIAVLHDRDALGIYRKNEETATTPQNAAGLYYNTYWHENQLWFNDTSENFVVFTLN